MLFSPGWPDRSWWNLCVSSMAGAFFVWLYSWIKRAINATGLEVSVQSKEKVFALLFKKKRESNKCPSSSDWGGVFNITVPPLSFKWKPFSLLVCLGWGLRGLSDHRDPLRGAVEGCDHVRPLNASQCWAEQSQSGAFFLGPVGKEGVRRCLATPKQVQLFGLVAQRGAHLPPPMTTSLLQEALHLFLSVRREVDVQAVVLLAVPPGTCGNWFNNKLTFWSNTWQKDFFALTVNTWFSYSYSKGTMHCSGKPANFRKTNALSFSFSKVLIATYV